MNPAAAASHPGPPGDIAKTQWCDVRFWHKADIPTRSMNVAFGGHRVDAAQCPLMTQSGHSGLHCEVMSASFPCASLIQHDA